MSNDLVKRLRSSTQFYHADCELKMACAGRIEELEAKLAKAVRALEYYGGWSDGSGSICGFDGGSLASTTLEELKGQ